MLYGPQRDLVEIDFSIPSECAAKVDRGEVDIGLVPVAQILRQNLEVVSNVGIAADGPVRSILLFSRKPWKQVRSLAGDLSSRTSVELAKIILRERFGVQPTVAGAQPDLSAMLEHCDAALIIGDPALRIDPDKQPYDWLDLGAEWKTLCGLPMVFAAWAGKARTPTLELEDLTTCSYEFGKERIEEIADREYERRGVSRGLALHYLRDHIHYELGVREKSGMEAFMKMLRSADGG
jgi:predicted solute-binding protein